MWDKFEWILKIVESMYKQTLDFLLCGVNLDDAKGIMEIC